jgi:hypothetical protein
MPSSPSAEPAARPTLPLRAQAALPPPQLSRCLAASLRGTPLPQLSASPLAPRPSSPGWVEGTSLALHHLDTPRTARRGGSRQRPSASPGGRSAGAASPSPR